MLPWWTWGWTTGEVPLKSSSEAWSSNWRYESDSLSMVIFILHEAWASGPKNIVLMRADGRRDQHRPRSAFTFRSLEQVFWNAKSSWLYFEHMAETKIPHMSALAFLVRPPKSTNIFPTPKHLTPSGPICKQILVFFKFKNWNEIRAGTWFVQVL